MAEHLPYDYNQEKLIELALVHDLGEIYAGDTFLYSDKRQQADEEERKGIELLQAHAFIADINPDVHGWFEEKIALAEDLINYPLF